MKLVNHRLKLVEWKYQQESVDNSLWRGYIKWSGLFPLVDNTYQTVNHVVITAFVERWYPETNMFHMSFGEMTITLDDVSTLLAIPVVRRTVSHSIQDDDDDDDDDNAVTLLCRTL